MIDAELLARIEALEEEVRQLKALSHDHKHFDFGIVLPFWRKTNFSTKEYDESLNKGLKK
jgi:hypothetical protein